MVQIRSRLDVADNTGAKMAKMIGVIGKKNKMEASVSSPLTSARLQPVARSRRATLFAP
jgi:large subunit ribosomal protein L14